MTRFTIASFNVKNLIGPEREFYRFQRYTPEEYAWKADWMADQTADAGCGYRRLSGSLRGSTAAACRSPKPTGAARWPPCRQHPRSCQDAITARRSSRNWPTAPMREAELAFAPNLNDTGEPGKRRPGLAVLSRFGFEGDPEVIQDLDPAAGYSDGLLG